MALPGLLAANNLNDLTNVETAWDNIGENISADIFVPLPSLDLNFAANKNLVDNVSGNNLITFSRASTATFVGSNGLVQTAASGVPRFDHNPMTGESIGLLMEGESTNTFTYSEQFDNAQWVLGGNVPGTTNVSANQTTAPDGTSAADLITISSTTSRFGVGVAARTGCAANAAYTASFFVKAKELTRVAIVGWDSGSGTRSSGGFNMATQSWYGTSYGVFNRSYQAFPNGWYRLSFTFVTSFAGVNAVSILIPNPDGTATDGFYDSGFLYDGTPYSGQGFYVWGAQLEISSFPSSYISTASSAVTRASDLASITGSNFSSFYNQDEGTVLTDYKRSLYNLNLYPSVWGVRDSVPGAFINGMVLVADYNNSYDRLGGTNIFTTPQVVLPNPIGRQDKNAVAFKNGSLNMAINGVLGTPSSSNIYPSGSVNRFDIAGTPSMTFKRITYYAKRLTDPTLQALSSYGVVSSFSYSFSIKGKDIAALKEVNKASTRDFVFIKGLTSRAQPRITTASQYTSSGVALRNVAMLRNAPTTSGNYFFSSGLTLSGITCKINGTNALSIATSPFSSSSATVPLLFAGLQPQANWRFTEPMVSGTVASPEKAIPIENDDFLLFIKAGQN